MKNGEFPRLITQESQYLLGNGVTLTDEKQKEVLGTKFDRVLQQAGMQSLVDGVNWGFWNINQLVIFRATEFAPLMDEETGNLRMGIRFWQLDEKKPMYVELYELNGLTKLKVTDGSVTETQKQTPYRTKVFKDETSEFAMDTDNWSEIPIYPLYGNDLHRSELTDGMKGHIDAHDFIASDLADGITHVEGVYWYISNFGGDDAAQLIKEIQELKATYEVGDSKAENWVVEVPYEAKRLAMECYKKQIRSDYMGLDTEAITGGSLTNVAINVAETDLGLKADKFEWQVVDFVQNILRLLGFEDSNPQFKRRTIKNDTETTDNISTMRSDGYLTPHGAIDLSPIIPEKEKQNYKDAIDNYSYEQGKKRFPLSEE